MKKNVGTELGSTSATPKELVEILIKSAEARIPTLVLGSPGLGKSSIIEQVAERLNRVFLDLRLSYMDPVDLHGLPTVGADGVMRFARPWCLPDDPASVGLMCLDEITSVVPAMQVPAYQLVLNHRVGEHKIYGDWFIVGAGNLDSDQAVTFGMSSALVNRFQRIILKPSAPDWIDWAMTAGITPEVIGYIKMFESSLSEEPCQSPFASPRSWERVSNLLKSPTQVSREIELKMIAGNIGDGEAGKFVTHLHRYRQLPDFQDILNKPKSTQVPNDPASQYSLAVALGDKATLKNIAPICAYVSRMQAEMQVLCAHMVIKKRNDNGITTQSSVEFRDFVKDLRQYLF